VKRVAVKHYCERRSVAKCSQFEVIDTIRTGKNARTRIAVGSVKQGNSELADKPGFDRLHHKCPRRLQGRIPLGEEAEEQQLRLHCRLLDYSAQPEDTAAGCTWLGMLDPIEPVFDHHSQRRSRSLQGAVAEQEHRSRVAVEHSRCC